jgi:hypothetical protein
MAHDNSVEKHFPQRLKPVPFNRFSVENHLGFWLREQRVPTTNTYENMPTLAGDGYPSLMVLDHTGKILAVATGTG